MAGAHHYSTQGAVHHPLHRTGAFAFKPHHRKAYRKRHILMVVTLYGVSLLSAAGLSILASRSTISISDAQAQQLKTQFTDVTTNGFSLQYTTAAFIESQVKTDARESVTLRPNPTISEGRLAASRLRVSYQPNTKNLLAAFAPTSDELFAVSTTKISDEIIAGVPFTKYVHKHTPLYSATAKPVYSVQWLAQQGADALSITVDGLIDSSDIPVVYEPVFASLSFVGGPGVLGSSVTKFFKSEIQPPSLSQRYVADAISPAVVKIYNIVCGVVLLDGRQVSQDGCKATVGSGFFVSSDGYIATNGHVVVFEPEDAFVQLLFNEPQMFADYLRSNGLSSNQIQQLINRPDLLAAVVAEIYSLPKGTVQLINKEHIILVAHGDDPLQVGEKTNYRELAKINDSDTLKRATLVASDYSARDTYVVSSGDERGFSSSDVALVKVNIRDAPYIRAIENSIITQNQMISVLGFPADAENALINNSELAVTVTNGSIGSIRTASGSDNKLFQSDADASQGNSGGPAVTADGRVFGLLTYRFKNDAVQDAAKSYIRDFTDIKRLALRNGINFSQTGSVQENWETGLRYFAAGYYSTALNYFESVRAAYPSHRLTSQYIAATNMAIDSGQDVKSETVNFLAIGLVLGMLGGAGMTMIIIRHHARHKAWKLHFPAALHHA